MSNKPLYFRLTSLSLIVSAALLSACGGGGGSGSQQTNTPTTPPVVETVELSGGGIKGPMANAEVRVYRIDLGSDDFKGQLEATGRTDNSSRIVDLELTLPVAPPYLVEVVATDGTIDLSTGLPPVITTLQTILTAEDLDSGHPIYATPLTSMATRIALQNADSSDSPYVGNGDQLLDDNELAVAVAQAEQVVKSTFGFGLNEQVSLFDSSPVLDETTNSEEDQLAAVSYRSAIEATSAVVYQMQETLGNGASADSIVTALGNDLADGEIDGRIQGEQTEVYSTETLEVLAQNPAVLPIPNEPSGRTVSDVQEIVLEEVSVIGNSVDSSMLETSLHEIVLLPAQLDVDVDGDGALNTIDAFPHDASADLDSDGDGMPDVAYLLDGSGARSAVVDENRSDVDDDNDGVADIADAFPIDSEEFADTDEDGIGNSVDEDDDGDGVADEQDDFPLDATRSVSDDQDGDGWPVGQDSNDNDASIPGVIFLDSDGDGFADNGGLVPDNDDDNDGVVDADDAFPLDSSETSDLDRDGIGDNTDADLDGDGVSNEIDAFPYDVQESVDSDRDGVGNAADSDDDNDGLSDAQELELGTDALDIDSDDDGVLDSQDALPLNPAETHDTDGDGIGNNTDQDIDNDNVSNALDAFPFDNGESVDTDSDGIGNNSDEDDDNDGVNDTSDLFPLNPSESMDTDGDGVGNNADTDDDGDGVEDSVDAFPLNSAEAVDTDFDGVGNNTDTDDDGDGVLDVADLFPLDAQEWSDTDSDGIGNNTDDDDDGDGVLDAEDAFPFDSGESVDSDGDGFGDNIDSDDDGDGVEDSVDAFPFNPDEFADTDLDGLGNQADTDDDGDGVSDDADAFPLNPDESADTDSDGVGNNADNDDDGDGVADSQDLFPLDSSESADADSDGLGNNADTDDDNDGVADSVDDFPFDPSESADTDSDGIGNNVDEDDDGDGVPDSQDQFPLDSNESIDTDRDGVGNNADPDDDNDGIPDEEDSAPLLGRAITDISFIDPAIEACVLEQWGGDALEGLISEISCASVEIATLEDLLQFYHLQNLNLHSSVVSDWSAISDISQLSSLNVAYTNFDNLALLTGLPIVELELSGTNVSGLQDMSGWPLISLGASGLMLSDWSVVGTFTALETLNLEGSNFTPLSLLLDLPLKNLTLQVEQVSDDLAQLEANGVEVVVKIDHTSVEGKVITGSGYISNGESFEMAFDGDSNTKWLDHRDWSGAPSESEPSWIQVELPEPKAVNTVVITSANDAPERDPQRFSLLGSNDGGLTWHQVEKWNDAFFGARFQRQSFETPNTLAYQTYRLEITKNREDSVFLQLSDVALLGPEVEDIVLSYMEGAVYEARAYVSEMEATENAFDNNPDTKWFDHGEWVEPLSNDSPSWVTVSLPQAGVVHFLGLTSANDASERDPGDFYLEGSNDAENWSVIGEWQGVSFEERFERQVFEVSSVEAFSHYRLSVTRTSGGSQLMQVAEIELIGALSD